MASWSDRAYSERYNQLYGTPAQEFQALLDLLELSGDDDLLDLGCGNGDLLALAAGRVRSAVGVDLSGPQADEAERKLAGWPAVSIVRSSFLDFDPAGRTFSRGFSRKALHHLPDADKERFLARLGPVFRPGARFLLEDGMFFGYGREDLEARWEALMEEAARYYGDSWESKKEDIVHSFRAEFPTGEARWREILEGAGFRIEASVPRCSFYGMLLAVKAP